MMIQKEEKTKKELCVGIVNMTVLGNAISRKLLLLQHLVRTCLTFSQKTGCNCTSLFQNSFETSVQPNFNWLALPR